MTLETVKKIESFLGPILSDLGYDIVRIHMSGSRRPVLQIMIERLDEQGVTIEDCTTVSRMASAHLDVEGPIQSAFVLEVSSPGLDRPLVKAKDYQRFVGKEVLITLLLPLEGRKKLQGILEETDEDGLTLCLPTADRHRIKFCDIKSAKLFVDFAKV